MDETVITSTQNQFVKEVKALGDKKLRDKTGLFAVEGVNVFKDMPRDAAVEYVLVADDKREEAQNLLACTGARVYYVSRKVMDYASNTVSPYGLIAVCRKPEIRFAFPRGDAILLDGVSDPGNLGTLIRTAAAAGFDDVYLADTADVYSPKVVRATLGALFKVRITEVDVKTALGLIKNTNSAALDMDGVSLTDFGLVSPVLLIAGSEAHGVRNEFLKNAKSVVSLPMKNGIESLNVAVAASIAMYATVRTEEV